MMIKPCARKRWSRNDTTTKYSQTCPKWPLKIDKMKVLKTGGSLMQIENIAESSPFDLH